jgi:transposase-like protein
MAPSWLRVVNDLKTRGAQDILIAVVDGPVRQKTQPINALRTHLSAPQPEIAIKQRLTDSVWNAVN